VNSAYCMNERANPYCTDKPLQNLVLLGRHQILCKFSTNPQYLVKPSRIQRRINVDRVSIRKGLLRACRGAQRETEAVRYGSNDELSRPFTNADSYSRCFRYKRRIRQHAWITAVQVRRHVGFHSSPEGNCLNNLGRFISSQLDRILGLNKATTVSLGTFINASCPVGVCRIDWAAQLVNSTGIGVITFPVAKDISHIPGRISRDHVVRRQAVRC